MTKKKKPKHRAPLNVYQAVLMNQENYVPIGLPEEPTAARPGTPDKVAVLRARLEAGVEMWHPDDETLYGVDPPECRADPMRATIRQIMAPTHIAIRPDRRRRCVDDGNMPSAS